MEISHGNPAGETHYDLADDNQNLSETVIQVQILDHVPEEVAPTVKKMRRSRTTTTKAPTTITVS